MDKSAGELACPDTWVAEGWGDVHEGERRAAPRVMVLIRPGKLIADGHEYLCVVRDVSAGGVKVRLFHPLPSYSTLEIEFDNGERYGVERVWHTDDLAGLVFTGTVDVVRLIERQADSHPRRQPRMAVEVDAVLCSAGLRLPIKLRDISQRGASIECDGWLMIDELVRIESPDLPTLHAKVRWRRPPRYGLVFEQTFRLEELARACAVLAARG